MPLAADELALLADAALDAASGCQAAELRVERIRSQMLRLHDAHPETTADDTNFGMGVRVVVDGAVGFAATVDVRPEEAANLVRQAREMARVTSRAESGRVELAPEPPHGDVTWTSAFEIDPTAVPLADKVALLSEWSRRLGAHDAVSHTSASLLAVSEQTYLADLNGTRATQHRVRLQTQLEALALSDSGFETMRTLAPPVGRGWEFLVGPNSAGAWHWDEELAELPELLAEKLPRANGRGRDIRPGRRPLEPLAHHPRVDRARHRAGPGRRLRGGLRRHIVRHVRPAGVAGLWLPRHARDRGSHGEARPGDRRH